MTVLKIKIKDLYVHKEMTFKSDGKTGSGCGSLSTIVLVRLKIAAAHSNAVEQSAV